MTHNGFRIVDAKQTPWRSSDPGAKERWSYQENVMTENLFIGCLMMTACVVIQCVVVALLLHVVPFLERNGVLRLTVLHAVWLLTSVLLIMFVGNLLQIAAWAGILLGFGEFGDFATAFYHSMVNFTTLGYGDLVMSEKHRLLGALEAANGVLMFGLTTGVLFALMQVLIRRASQAHPRG